jgi:hypothetical protein
MIAALQFSGIGAQLVLLMILVLVFVVVVQDVNSRERDREIARMRAREQSLKEQLNAMRALYPAQRCDRIKAPETIWRGAEL